MPYSKIRLLDISDNKIKDKGLMYIFHTLKKPYVMQLLYFWGNSFDSRTNKVETTFVYNMKFRRELVVDYTQNASIWSLATGGHRYKII